MERDRLTEVTFNDDDNSKISNVGVSPTPETRTRVDWEYVKSGPFFPKRHFRH